MGTKKSGSRQERTDGKLGRDRAVEDRSTTDDRELSDPRRLEEYRQQFFQSALPDLPKKPGYHRCWLTTTNPRDPIHGRLRIGYRLLTKDDVPGWEHSTLKSGDHQGCIGVNEMLAAEIRTELYETYMTESHHTQPLSEEEKLTVAARTANEQLQQKGARLIQEEGNEKLGHQVPPPPSFSEQIGEGLADGGD